MMPQDYISDEQEATAEREPLQKHCPKPASRRQGGCSPKEESSKHVHFSPRLIQQARIPRDFRAPLHLPFSSPRPPSDETNDSSTRNKLQTTRLLLEGYSDMLERQITQLQQEINVLRLQREESL